jgi:hypothetical protein
VKFQFLCPAVSFVAIGEVGKGALEETPSLAIMSLRKPSSVSCGLADFARPRAAPVADGVSIITLGVTEGSAGCCFGGSGSSRDAPPPAPLRLRVDQPQSSAPVASSSREREALDKLLTCQRVDGHFELVGEAADLVGGAAVLEGKRPSDVPKGVWETCIVIAFLGQRAPSLVSEWSLVVAKARSWVASHSSVSVAKCLAAASMALGTI